MASYHDTVLGTANLVAYWKLAETTGSTIADYGPNHYDLTISSVAAMGVASIVPNDTSPCMDFNGTSNYAYLPGTAPANLQAGSAITVEFFVQNDTFGNRCPVGLFGSSTAKGYWFNMTSNPNFWISTDGSAQVSAASPSAMIAGTTYHIVGTYDGENVAIYVNGALANSNPAPSGAIFNVSTANAFTIGRLGALASDFMDGRVDEVSIYKRVLTAGEISAHYQAAIAPITIAAPQVITGRKGSAKITPKLYRADKLNQWTDDLSSLMLSGTVEMQTGRRIKMQFQGALRYPERLVPFVDYLAPVLKIQYSDGSTVTEQLGLFSTAPFAIDSSFYTSTGQFTALDLGWNLSENTFGTYKTVAAGANVVDTVISILSAEGFTRVSIPASSRTFVKTHTYDITRDKWNICNAMLHSIGYYHLWVDRVGVITSMPYLDYDQAQPAKVLSTGLGSDLVGLIRKEPVTDIFNKVRVIGERPSTGTAIIQTLINSSPASPTSTVNLGRTRQRRPDIKDSDINDTATALETARRALQEASSMYTRYTLQTLPDPARNFFEVYSASINRIDGVSLMAGNYRVSGWKISMDHRTPMEHYLNRLEVYQ